MPFAKVEFLPFYDGMNSGSHTPEAEVIVELHALWNSGDLSKIPQIYSEYFVAHMPKGWKQSEFHGHRGVKGAILRIRSAFADWHEEIEDMVVEQGKVVTRYVSTGTHTGKFIGLEATGCSVKIDEMSIYHIENNLVIEQWCLTDDLSLAQQLGLIEA